MSSVSREIFHVDVDSGFSLRSHSAEENSRSDVTCLSTPIKHAGRSALKVVGCLETDIG